MQQPEEGEQSPSGHKQEIPARVDNVRRSPGYEMGV